MSKTTPARTPWLLPLLVALTGCPPPRELPPPPQLSRSQAVAFVNRNNARIESAVQAKRVTASGHFTDDQGDRHNYNLEGGILYLRPHYLYFDLRQLGQTVMRFGSNELEYWLWIQPELDTLWWGTYAGLEQADPAIIPIRPDLLIEALGLNVLPDGPEASRNVLYRVMGEHNQFLWAEWDADGTGYLDREYWLDRRPPHLIRKILARNEKGRLTFYAELDDHRLIRDTEALAAHRITLHWLEPDSVMCMRIGHWKVRDGVSEASSAFTRRPGRPTTICVD
jgi:hypothetical protein